MVYFIANPENLKIKIGVTDNLIRRFLEIEWNYPNKLQLLGVIGMSASLSQSRNAEKALHKRFSEYKVSNEWFTYNETIENYIMEYANNDIGIGKILDITEITPKGKAKCLGVFHDGFYYSDRNAQKTLSYKPLARQSAEEE